MDQGPFFASRIKQGARLDALQRCVDALCRLFHIESTRTYRQRDDYLEGIALEVVALPDSFTIAAALCGLEVVFGQIHGARRVPLDVHLDAGPIWHSHDRRPGRNVDAAGDAEIVADVEIEFP